MIVFGNEQNKVNMKLIYATRNSQQMKNKTKMKPNVKSLTAWKFFVSLHVNGAEDSVSI